jgi:hypothetical protein
MTQPALRPLTVGEILDQAFGLYRRYLPALVTIALVCTAVPQLGLSFIAVKATSPEGMVSVLPQYLLLAVALLILNQLAIGASTLVLAEGYLGRSLGTGESLRRAWGLIGQIIVLAMLTSLALGLGFLLLIIPGFILLGGLAVSTPALMIEPGLGATGAMSRSWELTRGSRGRMIVLLVVPVVIIWVLVMGMAMVLGIIAAAVGGLKAMTTSSPSLGFTVATEAISLVVRTFLTPLVYCVITVAYFDLRVRTEGFDLEVLATTLGGG